MKNFNREQWIVEEYARRRKLLSSQLRLLLLGIILFLVSIFACAYWFPEYVYYSIFLSFFPFVLWACRIWELRKCPACHEKILVSLPNGLDISGNIHVCPHCGVKLTSFPTMPGVMRNRLVSAPMQTHTKAMINPQEYIDRLNWRYACKKFDASRQIPSDTWDALEEALRLSPSSVGLQPWHFIVVDSPEIRARLREISWDQPQVTDASRYVVLCSRRDVDDSDVDSLLDLMRETRGVSEEQLKGTETFMRGYVHGMNPAHKDSWIEAQVHIAVGFLASAAASFHVDSCIIGGMNRIACDEILGLTGGRYRSVVGVALGYRSPEDAYAQDAKVRFSKEQVIEHR